MSRCTRVRTDQNRPSILADLDSDGHLDIVTGAYWRRNNGRGELGTSRQYAFTSPQAVAAADIDGDGDPDLIAIQPSGLVWYQNVDGAGGFGRANSIAPTSLNASLVGACRL